MLEKIKHSVLGVKRIAGVEAILNSDGKIMFNMVVLSIKKGIITIEKKIFGVEGLDDFVTQIPEGIAISLVLNGRGILHKKFNNLHEGEYTKVIQEILPNANVEDFYLQQFINDSGNFVSIARKNVIDNLLSQLKERKQNIINLALGPFTVNFIIPLLEIKEAISLPNFILQFNKNEIKEIKTNNLPVTEKELFLGKEKLEINLLIAYSSALQMLLPSVESVCADIDSVVQEKEEFVQKNIFKVAGWGVLIAFLMLLMVNFFLFSYFSSESQQLLSKESISRSMITKMESLQKDVKEKESFLSNAGWLQSSKASFYSDRIAASVPTSIRLTELRVNPINEKQSRQEKKNVFETNTLRIAGICNKPTELNPWINKIKEIEGVKIAEIENYTFDNKEREGHFKIVIQIK